MICCAISDRRLFRGDESDQLAALRDQARRVAEAGIDLFLLREPDLPPRALADLARELLCIVRAADSPTRLLMHAHPDIAVAVRADGVHLPSAPGALTPAQIRTLFGRCRLPRPTVTRSCHTLADVTRALPGEAQDASGPDLLLFGPVFEKRVHDRLVQPGTGLDRLRDACAHASPTPVLALGGITHANTPGCMEAGAAGIAAIRLFTGDPAA